MAGWLCGPQMAQRHSECSRDTLRNSRRSIARYALALLRHTVIKISLFMHTTNPFACYLTCYSRQRSSSVQDNQGAHLCSSILCLQASSCKHVTHLLKSSIMIEVSMTQDDAPEVEGARPELVGERSDVIEEARVPEEGTRPKPHASSSRLSKFGIC